MSPGVTVWFYGDYGCPFSYLADRRLELLARERPVAVRWRPLAVYPGARPRRGAGVSEPGAADETRGEAGAGAQEALRDELREAARALGLPFRATAAPADTREALQAAEFARDLGRAHFARLHRGLFRARFAEGRDIGSRRILLEVAREAGVDEEGLESALEDGRYEAELQSARQEAERYGITGTPGLLFGRFLLIGAAPLPELRRAADRAEREEVSGPA